MGIRCQCTIFSGHGITEQLTGSNDGIFRDDILGPTDAGGLEVPVFFNRVTLDEGNNLFQVSMGYCGPP